jgi:hypothetical protein
VVNSHNDSEAVEVIGGRAGDRRIRSFDPGRIYAVTRRRQTRTTRDRAVAGELSVAEAPQLPLG